MSRKHARLATLAASVPLLDTRAALPAAKTAHPFYLSNAWRALVAELIRDRGRRCEDRHCDNPHRAGIRVFGDHIVELADGGAPLDKRNVMLRCGSCHTRKTAERRAQRARA